MTLPKISCQLASCQVLLMGVLLGICMVEEGRTAAHPASHLWQNLEQCHSRSRDRAMVMGAQPRTTAMVADTV